MLGAWLVFGWLDRKSTSSEFLVTTGLGWGTWASLIWGMDENRNAL